MRRTQKYLAAVTAYGDLKQGPLAPALIENQEKLYDWLAAKQYAWDSKKGKWEKVQRPVDSSGREKASIFTNPDGTPTDVFRLRVMAHPDQIERIAAALEGYFTPIESASKPYPNRKGPGSRVYMTLLFQDKRKPGLRRMMAESKRAAEVEEEEDEE